MLGFLTVCMHQVDGHDANTALARPGRGTCHETLVMGCCQTKWDWKCRPPKWGTAFLFHVSHHKACPANRKMFRVHQRENTTEKNKVKNLKLFVLLFWGKGS